MLWRAACAQRCCFSRTLSAAPWRLSSLNTAVSPPAAHRRWRGNWASTAGVRTWHGRYYNSAAAAGGHVCTSNEDEPADLRLLRRLRMHPEQIVADESFDRRWLLPASMANHASLGAIFAWSALSQPLLRINGVLVPSAADWVLSDISFTFSLVMGGFVWGAVFGRFHDRWGPRACGVLGGLQVGAGFGLGSLAIASSNLPLLYFGGLVWGLAMGWAYVPPLANVIKWYPEKKGFASGAVVVGYGGGPLIAVPLYYELIQRFQRPPEFLGRLADVPLVTREGRLYAARPDAVDLEVVVCTSADIQKTTFPGLVDGVYVVGSGSTGASEAFACLGATYAATIVLAAMVHKLAPQKHTASCALAGANQATSTERRPTGVSNGGPQQYLTQHHVPPSVAVRSSQFWLMYCGFGFSITGAYGMLSSSSLMLTDCFGGSSGLPNIVTPYFASQFVSMTAVRALCSAGPLVLY